MALRPVQPTLTLGPVKPARIDGRAPREVDPVMAKAGRILSRRPHSARELHDKLWSAGFAEDEIERAVERLVELKLVDDLDFARRWAEERTRTRGLGSAAVLAELEAKGVDTEIARQAVAELGVDEESRASELAAAYIKRVSTKPPLVQAQRIQAMLLRKGFSMEAAVAAARAVLPPEGWD